MKINFRLMKFPDLSKENPISFVHLFWLAAAVALTAFPGGVPVEEISIEPWAWRVWIPGALLAVAACNLVRHLGPVGWPWRVPLFLPLALPVMVLLGPIPHPIYALAAVLPWCALWLSVGPAWLPGRPLAVQLLAAGFTLLVAVEPARHLVSIETEAFPRLFHNQFMYVWAALLVPVGLASRSFLRRFARGLLKIELVILFVLLMIPPLIWLGATSLKEPGETARAPERLAPLPRLRVNTEFEWKTRLPDAWFVYPDTLDLLRAWNETCRLLSRRSLLSAFAGSDMPLPPERMLRALRIHDFLLYDAHGYFVPESAFTREVPAQMDPDAHIWIERLRRHATMTPQKLAGRLRVDTRQALLLLRRMRELDLVRRLPGGGDRFRPTADARKPLPGGWHPRMLLIAALSPEDHMLSRGEYGREWGLDLAQVREELRHMRDNGLLQPVEGLHPDLHRAILSDQALGRRVALHLFALYAALMIGKYLPTDLPSMARLGPTLLALMALSPWRVDPLLDVPVRVAAGCWLFRYALPDANRWINRVCLFAALCGWTHLMPLMQEGPAPLEVRAAWATIWLLPALPLLVFLTRPLPEK